MPKLLANKVDTLTLTNPVYIILQIFDALKPQYSGVSNEDDKAAVVEDVVAGSVVDVNGGGVGARIRRRHSANPRLGADGLDGKEGKNGSHGRQCTSRH